MTNEEKRNLHVELLEKNGARMQIIQAIEELSELQQALTKFLRGKHNLNNVNEEIADVLNTLNVLENIVWNKKLVSKYMDAKLKRTKERLDKGEL